MREASAHHRAVPAVIVWTVAAFGWAALFLLTVGSGESGIGAALWDGNAHHVVAGASWESRGVRSS